jgi:hypothetical protein
MDIRHSGITLEAEDFIIFRVDGIDGPLISQGKISDKKSATTIGFRSSTDHGYSPRFKKEIH